MKLSLAYGALVALSCIGLAGNGHAARMATDRDAVPAQRVAGEAPVRWEPFSEQLFERAKRERRFVLLDLEAVWCHWCHVMEETTYHDAQVAAALSAHYIAAKADRMPIPICRGATTNTAGWRPSYSRRTGPRSSSAPAICSPMRR